LTDRSFGDIQRKGDIPCLPAVLAQSPRLHSSPLLPIRYPISVPHALLYGQEKFSYQFNAL
jgi:hypothetical protein